MLFVVSRKNVHLQIFGGVRIDNMDPKASQFFGSQSSHPTVYNSMVLSPQLSNAYKANLCLDICIMSTQTWSLWSKYCLYSHSL